MLLSRVFHMYQAKNFGEKNDPGFPKDKEICLFEEERLHLQVQLEEVCHASYWVIVNRKTRRVGDCAKDDGEEVLTSP